MLKFSNNDIDEFILLLRKGAYPYECIDDSENSSEIVLPEKEELCSILNMEKITDADYMPAKELVKTLKKKNFGDYHHLYLSSDAFKIVRIRHFKIFI